MNRKIFLALAAIAGVCAAILLFPARQKEDADVAVGYDHGQAAGDEGSARARTRKGAIGDEDVEAEEEELPEQKAAAAEANAARHTTPFYQHTQAVGKRWLVLANTLGPQGHEELAAEMRAVSRELRAASLPDGTAEAQAAALEHEARTFASLRELPLEGEAAQVRDYLEQALKAVTEGEAPPKAAATAGEGLSPMVAPAAEQPAP